jgi:hypothetical protein
LGSALRIVDVVWALGKVRHSQPALLAEVTQLISSESGALRCLYQLAQ